MGRDSKVQASSIGVILVALGASLWGTDALIRRPLVDDMSATAIVLAEHLFLMLFAIPVLIRARSFFGQLTRNSWLALMVIGWGGSGLATVLFTKAFVYGNPTTVILLQKAQPLVVVLLAAMVLKERLPRAYWPLFVIAVIGGYLVSFGTLRPVWELAGDQLTAAGLALAAAALWGGSTVMGRFMLSNVSFSTLTAARFTMALPFLFVLALIQGDLGGMTTGLSDQPSRLFLLALIPGLVAMLIYYQGLSRTRASYATLAELAYPATAVIVNWIFLDQSINGIQFFGFAVLWIAIAALNWLPELQARRARSAVAPG